MCGGCVVLETPKGSEMVRWRGSMERWWVRGNRSRMMAGRVQGEREQRHGSLKCSTKRCVDGGERI